MRTLDGRNSTCDETTVGASWKQNYNQHDLQERSRAQQQFFFLRCLRRWNFIPTAASSPPRAEGDENNVFRSFSGSHGVRSIFKRTKLRSGEGLRCVFFDELGADSFSALRCWSNASGPDDVRLIWCESIEMAISAGKLTRFESWNKIWELMRSKQSWEWIFFDDWRGFDFARHLVAGKSCCMLRLCSRPPEAEGKWEFSGKFIPSQSQPRSVFCNLTTAHWPGAFSKAKQTSSELIVICSLHHATSLLTFQLTHSPPQLPQSRQSTSSISFPSVDYHIPQKFVSN